MSIKTIRKSCLFSIIIGFGVLPSLSQGGNVTSTSKGAIGRTDKDVRIYNGSYSFIGCVDSGDIVGALYLLKDKF